MRVLPARFWMMKNRIWKRSGEKKRCEASHEKETEKERKKEEEEGGREKGKERKGERERKYRGFAQRRRGMDGLFGRNKQKEKRRKWIRGAKLATTKTNPREQRRA